VAFLGGCAGAQIAAPSTALTTAVGPASRSSACRNLSSSGGYLKSSNGTTDLYASFGYATNPGGVRDCWSFSTSNVYGAPAPPSGWSAVFYEEMTFRGSASGEWGASGPQEYIEASCKYTSGYCERNGYYCMAWYVRSGSQWNEEWASETIQPFKQHGPPDDGVRSIRELVPDRHIHMYLYAAAPDYTPFFSTTIIERVNSVFELLRPPGDDQC
jgi:hypothetical protein